MNLKTHLRLLTAACLCAAAPCLAADPPPGPSAGLVAHWGFEGGHESYVIDYTGNGNMGLVQGAAYAPGRFGRGLRFDGEDDVVDMEKTDHLNAGGAQWTVAAWIKPESDAGVIVGRGGGWTGYALYLREGRLCFTLHLTREGPAHTVSSRDGIGGDWTHAAGVIREGRIELYVDGRLQGSTRTGGSLGSSGQGFQLGYDLNNSAGELNEHFRGVMDEVRMYQRALSAAEVEKLARLEVTAEGPPEAATSPQAMKKLLSRGLAAYWNLDGARRDVVPDHTANGNDARLRGGIYVSSPFGNGLRLHGGKDGLDAGNSKTLTAGGRSWTVAAWIRPDAPDGVIVGRGGEASGYSLYLKDGRPCCTVRRSREEALTLAADRPLHNEWTHLAAVIGERRAELHVNGELRDSGETGGALPAGTQGLQVGYREREGAGGVPAPFRGSIDEVRIYNRALSPEEVSALHGLQVEPKPGTESVEPTGAMKRLLTEGLHAYWDFDGRGSDLGRDRSSGRNALRIRGARRVRGRFGGGLRLDGGDGFAETARSDARHRGPSTWTVAAWVKPDGSRGTVAAGSDGAGFALCLHDGKLLLAAGTRHVVGTEEKVEREWMHVVGVFRRRQIELTVNGSLVGRLPTRDAPPAVPNTVRLGYDPHAGTAGRAPDFTGVIDEVRIYRRALSPDEIRMLHRLQIHPEPGAGG